LGGGKLGFNIFFFHKGLLNGSEMYIKSKTEEAVFLKNVILLAEIARLLCICSCSLLVKNCTI